MMTPTFLSGARPTKELELNASPSCQRIEPFAVFLAHFRAHLRHMERLMGGLLVLTGVAFLTGLFTQLNNWLIETFPALQSIG